MEATSSASSSHVELASPSATTTPPILRLRLQKKKSPKQVVWSDGTVDNEHMNKKKSKCCCIYKKPLAFGESSSEEEEDCEHCYGHPEKRIKSHGSHNHQHPTTSDTVVAHRTDQCDSGICTLKKNPDNTDKANNKD